MRNKILILLALLISVCSLHAQLSLSAQLRARAEFRDGQGAPLPHGTKPAAFISQRTRLNAQFDTYRLKFGLSLQDVRVWGQDASTINRFTTPENNGLLLHQAWAEILLSDTAVHSSSLSVKIGRQELVYDDQRLIGNLDWLQQGRRHDAALLKYEKNNWSVHLAAAFNQNKENASGTVYNNSSAGNYPATTNGGVMYKSIQFLYAGKKLKKGNASFLFFSDQFNRYQMEIVDNVPAKAFLPGVWPRFTTGLYYLNALGNMELNGAAYYQFGKNSSGQNTKAIMATLATQYSFGKLSAGPGIDYTSGGTKNNISRAFDPLYGTPHKFWGLMDYFYARTGFGKGGLVDYYFKMKLRCSERLNVAADAHHFLSATAISSDAMHDRKKFGDEIDLVASYVVTKQVSLEGGYSHFFSTALLTSSAVKNIPNARGAANWAYVMINIKPDFLFK